MHAGTGPGLRAVVAATFAVMIALTGGSSSSGCVGTIEGPDATAGDESQDPQVPDESIAALAGCPELPVQRVVAKAFEVGNGPENTLDHSLGTRWSCLGGGCWIQYDLGIARSVKGVAVAWYNGATRTFQYEVATSNDGTSFTRVASGSSSLTTQLQHYPFAETSARYVRLTALGNTATGNTATSWQSVTEVNACAGTPPPLTTQQQYLKTHLESGITGFMASINDSSAESRKAIWAALGMLTLGQSASSAETLIRRVLDRQKSDGTIPWNLNNDNVNDANATAFVMQSLAPLLSHYSGRLSSGFRSYALPKIAKAIDALKAHVVPESYTNIFVMQTVDRILLSEWLGDSTRAAEAYAELDKWIAYTKSAGIAEYDSPTYYKVTLGSLVMGYLYPRRFVERSKLKAALDYVWTDTGANYFEGRGGTLSGPHSRDYDFLKGLGGIELYTYTAGWRSQPGAFSLDAALLLESELNYGYQPSRGMRRPPSEQRVVTQWWGTNGSDGYDRYHYVTPGFTIGSVGRSAGRTDKNITVEVATAKNMPMITVIADDTDKPYGIASSTKDIFHLKHNPAVAQDKGVMLATLDVETRATSPTTVATNVVFPLDADQIRLKGANVDKTKLDQSNGYEIAAAMNDVLVIREGTSVVGVKFFRASACGGATTKIVLKSDSTGQPKRAARLAAYHWRSSTPLDNNLTCRARVGLLIKASSTLSVTQIEQELAATVTYSTSSTNVWTSSVTVGGVALRVSRDLANRTTLAREVNGSPMKFGRLTLNGQSIAPGFPTF